MEKEKKMTLELSFSIDNLIRLQEAALVASIEAASNPDGADDCVEIGAVIAFNEDVLSILYAFKKLAESGSDEITVDYDAKR